MMRSTHQRAAEVLGVVLHVDGRPAAADVVERDGTRTVLREGAAHDVEHEVGGVALRVVLQKWQRQHTNTAELEENNL